MLLKFSVKNFRCFADEAGLDLTSSKLRTNVPRDGQTWMDSTERVAAIYGSNAAGKTTVLDAIHALAMALRHPGIASIFQPTLGLSREERLIEYRLDFVAEEVRYHYEVHVAGWGIARESLHSYPKGTRRTLYSRTQQGEDAQAKFDRGSSLSGPTAEVLRITKPKMLFLGMAHKYGHEVLAPIARALIAGIGIDHISFRDRQDEEILRRVVLEMIAAPDSQVDLVKALVQAADLGLARIEIRTQEIPPEIHERILRIVAAAGDGEDLPEDKISQIRDVVTFLHRGENGSEFELPVRHQSSGTITWLTTAWHALDALRQGSVLLVDELDASLHPELGRYIVKLFLDPQLNEKGAQLIFTSHDASLLGNAPTRILEPANVWFVEKQESGHSELYSLADFDNRSGNNSERRYLAGQFGAVPDIDDRLVRRYIAASSGGSRV